MPSAYSPPLFVANLKYVIIISMSNPTVFVEIEDILNKLDNSQLFALAGTITQGLYKNSLNTRKDAIDIILKYSPNVVNILRRRTVTKDILFTYLHEKSVSVALPTTKDKLIDHICSFWNIQNQEVQDLATSEDIVPTRTENDINTMALQFTGWFYEMMNNDEMIDPTHFYPDASISLNMIAGSTVTHTEDAFEPEFIVDLLHTTKHQHSLFFNPSLNSEGVSGKIDLHGLVLIIACGTLHTGNECVGVFEQVFTLARDPYCENNWKIKTTQLNLRSETVTQQPKWWDSNLLAITHKE